MQYEKELAKKKKKGLDKDSSKPLNEPSSNMKEVLFALKYVLAVHDEPCHALTCTSPICPLDPTPSVMPLVGTNLLQEKEDEFQQGSHHGSRLCEGLGAKMNVFFWSHRCCHPMEETFYFSRG